MKILLAEDEPVLARFLTRVLSDYGECVHVASGLDALHAFEQAFEGGDPFGLIVLDIMMPELCGHDVLSEIREIEQRAGRTSEEGVSAIICSAFDDATDIYEAHSNGCVEFLVKPVGKRDIRRVLGRLGFTPNSLEHISDA